MPQITPEKIVSAVGLLSALVAALTPVLPEGVWREGAIALGSFLTGLGMQLRKPSK